MKLPTSLFVTCVVACFCNLVSADNSAPEITNVEPDFIKIRHSELIKVDIKNISEDAQISIAPGGTYIKNNTGLPSAADNILFADGILWVQQNRNDLAAYEISFTGKFQAYENIHFDKNIQHIAANGGMLLVSDESNTLFSYNTINEIVKREHKQLPGDISALSLSETHICAVVDSNIMLLDKETLGVISSSEKLSNGIEHIATISKQCLTLNKSQGLQLWKSKNDKLENISHFNPNNRAYQLLINNGLVILANGKTGVTILDTHNDELHWRGSYNKLGNVTQVAAADNELLTADDQGTLTLFDISQPETPLLISDFKQHSNIDKLQFSNKQAYSLSGSSLKNIDFSAESPPIISTLGVNQGGSRRSTIKDDKLFVADWFSGMHIYDISIPNAPRLVSSFHTPGSPKGVVVKGDIAFVADDDHGLQIVDISNPLRPVFVSSIPLSGLAYTMKLIDNHLYIASHRGGFHIVDVSDVKQPHLISSYDTPGKSWALEYQNGLLYVADDSSGIMVFDVSKPAVPVLINQFNPNGLAEDIVLVGHTAYVAFFDLGLYILDISNPLNIQQIAHLPTPGNARGIEIHDRLLYLASWEAGVLIIDIGDSKQPKILGQYDTKGATWGLSVKDNVVYAMDWWGGVKVINAEQQSRPVLIGEYQTAGKIEDIIYHDRFIYTAHGSRGLQIYEASNSLNPVWATGKDFDGFAKSLSISDNQVFIAAGDAGLIVIDAKNPFQVHWLSQLKLTASADLIKTIDTQVFIAEYNGDLFQVDATQLTEPVLITRKTAHVQDMQVHNQQLYVLSESQSLDIFDVKKSTNDRSVTRIQLADPAVKIRLKDDLVLLLHPNKGISVYSLINNQLQMQSSFNTQNNIHDMLVDADKLYATTGNNELLVFNLQKNNILQLVTTYPTVHQLERITSSNNGIFFSGENIIASGQLLPHVKMQRSGNRFTLQIPENMPTGSYHLTVLDGKQNTRINAFKIGFPKLKSKFTMEDLKKKMQQKSFDGKVPE